MTSSNRTDELKRLYAELKKKYTAVKPVERTVLEHFLYATCLEDATYQAADAAFSALVDTMSGWNEVRVSSVSELAELMSQLPDPRETATRIRKILHAIFEERYTFDIDDIRKKNIKEAYEKLEAIPGGTPFSINMTAQIALGRHGIPVGNGEKRLLYVLGIIEEKDIEGREIAGLNRAIPKTQGMEFASLLHQLASVFVINPEARKIVSFLKAFAPDFRKRMPKRREIRKEDAQETPELAQTHETSRQNMMDFLINDPDFRQERKGEKYEESYDMSEERAKEAYLEEVARARRKGPKGEPEYFEDVMEEDEDDFFVEKPVKSVKVAKITESKSGTSSQGASEKAKKAKKVEESEKTAGESVAKSGTKPMGKVLAKASSKETKKATVSATEKQEKCEKTKPVAKFPEKSAKKIELIEKKTSAKVSKKENPSVGASATAKSTEKGGAKKVEKPQKKAKQSKKNG